MDKHNLKLLALSACLGLLVGCFGSSDDDDESPASSSSKKSSSSEVAVSSATSSSTDKLSSSVGTSSGELSSGEVSSSAFVLDSSLIPDPFEVAKKLGRGINLGNHFEAEGDLWQKWGQVYDEEDFPEMVRLGFTHVRVPVRWHEVSSDESPFTIREYNLNRIKEVVADAKAVGLMIIINQHHFEPLYDDIEAETEKFLGLWKQIAETFKDEGDYLLFEVLNEPRGQITIAEWNKLYKKAIEVIRETNPYRTLVLGGVDWNSISGLHKMAVPQDKNIIGTFHYYDPFQFTHQDAEWVDGSEAWLGTTWSGTKSEQKQIKSALESAVEWSKTNNIPVYMGEFGAYSKADTTSRALWTEYVATIAQELEIPWAYWEWSAGYGIRNETLAEAQYTQYLVDALLNPTVDWEAWPPRPDLETLPSFVFEDFDDTLGDSPKTTTYAAAYASAEGFASLDSVASSWYVYFADDGELTDSTNVCAWYSTTGDTINKYEEVEAGAVDNFNTLFTENGYANRGFEGTMHLNGGKYPWAGFGANLHALEAHKYVDLTGLQAISFWAKGEGTLRLKLGAQMADEMTEDWGSFDVTLDLEETWTQHVIWLDEFKPSPYSGLAEAKASIHDAISAVNTLEFMGPQLAGNSADMQIKIALDDIRFHGIDETPLSAE